MRAVIGGGACRFRRIISRPTIRANLWLREARNSLTPETSWRRVQGVPADGPETSAAKADESMDEQRRTTDDGVSNCSVVETIEERAIG
jgi:hypothetical protein